ncbi:alkaline shock response membrane anchor protein AmaP [Nonomuraea sp. NBC_01738]|uniref:DUF6286 domain-containing protein n=1 Tax=Nonomuraea sp. NBC_01738 TaxID=2976003 RepID=UPI002E15297F|nr:alkaline shock response membrane anchor protein AmaP [Nonomuraea sp. NBC_01738]
MTGADRAALKAFRPGRTVPAMIVAGLLTVLGVVVAAEIISTLFGRPLGWLPSRQMLQWGRATAWQDPLVLIGGGVVALIGVVLVVAALMPGRPRLVAARTGDPDLIIGMRKKSFVGALARAAQEVPGVRGAQASMRGQTVRVTATTSGWDDDNTGNAVKQAVLTRMAALAPIQPYQVSVRTKERA